MSLKMRNWQFLMASLKISALAIRGENALTIFESEPMPIPLSKIVAVKF